MKEKLRILLIEDNPGDVDLIREMLPAGGTYAFEIEAVSRLADGIARLKTGGIDLVLLDLGLPDSKGLDTFRRLQAAEPDMPVIVLTGNSDKQAVADAAREGAQDYLVKGQINSDILERTIVYATERKRAMDDLRISENKYRSLHESLMDAFVRVDLDGRIIEFNNAYLNMLGYTPDELLKLTYEELTPAKWHDLEARIVEEQIMERGYSEVYEKEYIRRDGTVFPVELRAVLLRDSTGAPVNIWGIARDITERRKLQNEVFLRDQRLKSFFKGATAGLALLDRNMRYVHINDTLADMNGVPAEQHIGRTIREVLPEFAPALEPILQQVIATGTPVHDIEVTGKMSRPSHMLRYWRESFFPVVDSEGNLDGVGAIVVEVTGQKRAEKALQESEEKHRKLSHEFQILLDNIPDSIIHLTPDLRIIWANKAMSALAGCADPSTLNGCCCHESLWGHESPCAECPVLRSLESRGFEAETLLTPDNRLLEMRAVPILGQSGSVESIIKIIRDLTEHRNLENQMRQAQKMEAVGQLAGGIAHDFNNILSVIGGYGQIVLMKIAKDDPLRPNIENMIDGVDRAAHLTKDLLLFSKKQASERKPSDINDIIGQVERFLLRVIGEDIECKTVLHDGPILINADSNQLQQVLMNLAGNARDAMPHGGVFTITTEQVSLGTNAIPSAGVDKRGPYALINVSDTGEGMNEETRQRIFEPFFTTKEVGKGTGLGLAVAHGIIQQHDGFIEVESIPGKGSTFKIYLPVIRQKTKKENGVLQTDAPARGKETILLAEDDNSLRELSRSLLAQFGYTVIEAVDGEEAVNKFMENRDKIDLLLFDLIMPKMTGKEAYDKIVKIQPDIKVMFESGYSSDSTRIRESLDDRMSLISKPVSPTELLNKIREMLDKNPEMS
jgi:PAS domain S-box-containing protein